MNEERWQMVLKKILEMCQKKDDVEDVIEFYDLLSTIGYIVEREINNAS
jgi:hypothetical protein